MVNLQGAAELRAALSCHALLTSLSSSPDRKYHSHLLQFDGEGGWRFERLDASTRLSLQVCPQSTHNACLLSDSVLVLVLVLFSLMFVYGWSLCVSPVSPGYLSR